MTFVEAGEIFAYWQANPPPHVMLQAITRLLGWTPPAPPEAAPGLTDIAATAPPGLIVTHAADPAMPPPLSTDALRQRNQVHAAAIARRNLQFPPLPRWPGESEG